MNRKIFYRLIGFLCLVTLCVGLAACGNDSKTENSATPLAPSSGDNVTEPEKIKVKKELRFHEDGTFKIVILSDLRLKDTPDAAVIANIEKVLDEAKPDLVILGGDVHDGSVSNENGLRAVLDAVTGPIESRKIPWCHAFGVDSAKSGYKREDQMTVYDSYEYCVSEKSVADAYGVSNFVLPIRHADGDKVGFNVYCLDSNGYLNDYVSGLESQVLLKKKLSGGSEFDCLHYSQLLWYWNTSVAFEEYNGGQKVPSMMYFQLPPWQFYYVLRNKEDLKMEGTRKESLTSSERESGVVWACYERGDIKGIFCGYDAKNDFSGTYLNMLLATCSTVGTGADAETAGARVISLSDNGSKMESSMLYLKDMK